MDDLPLLTDLWATADRFLWHPATQTAILADLHMRGALNRGDSDRSHLIAAWTRLVDRRPAQVILAGDLLDQPDAGSAAVAACRDLLAMLPMGCRVKLTPGNHDPLDLDASLGVDVAASYRLGRYVISHGHEIPPDIAWAPEDAWIVGHQHPAVVLRDRVRSAKMACYAVCTKTGGPMPRRMVLLPAFSREAGGPLGSNLLTARRWLLPVPKPKLDRTTIFGIVEPTDGPAQVLDFGPLAALR